MGTKSSLEDILDDASPKSILTSRTQLLSKFSSSFLIFYLNNNDVAKGYVYFEDIILFIVINLFEVVAHYVCVMFIICYREFGSCSINKSYIRDRRAKQVNERLSIVRSGTGQKFAQRATRCSNRSIFSSSRTIIIRQFSRNYNVSSIFRIVVIINLLQYNRHLSYVVHSNNFDFYDAYLSFTCKRFFRRIFALLNPFSLLQRTQDRIADTLRVFRRRNYSYSVDSLSIFIRTSRASPHFLVT